MTNYIPENMFFCTQLIKSQYLKCSLEKRLFTENSCTWANIRKKAMKKMGVCIFLMGPKDNGRD